MPLMVVCNPLLQADCEGSTPHLLRRLLRHTEVADPQLVGPPRLEMAVYPVEWARRFHISNRGTHNFSTHDAAQASATHQPLHGAARHVSLLTAQLSPHLVGAVGLQVGLPDTLDLGAQHCIARARQVRR